MKPQFLYFDMGNVLLRFSHERMAEQMARVAGIDRAHGVAHPVRRRRPALGLRARRVTARAVLRRFCEAAGSDFPTSIPSMLPATTFLS